MIYEYKCQACPNIVERRRKCKVVTCFECKTRHQYYNQARRKKESLARPYKYVILK